MIQAPLQEVTEANRPGDTLGTIRLNINSPMPAMWVVVESDYDVKIYEKFFSKNQLNVRSSLTEGEQSCNNVELIVKTVLEEVRNEDFDLIADPVTGKGYLYFDADHNSMLCMELSAEYLRAEKEVVKSYANLHPPFTREAPALLEKGGKKYMLTSGMTGYVPNRSDSSVCESWDGVFESLGDPHVNDSSCASFNSQISKIFRVEGTERFIAMADRWLPGTKVDARLADVFTRVIAGTYDPEHYQATEEERREMYEANKLETADTSIADYVWLPIEWESGKPVLRWQDSWKP